MLNAHSDVPVMNETCCISENKLTLLGFFTQKELKMCLHLSLSNALFPLSCQTTCMSETVGLNSFQKLFQSKYVCVYKVIAAHHLPIDHSIAVGSKRSCSLNSPLTLSDAVVQHMLMVALYCSYIYLTDERMYIIKRLLIIRQTIISCNK